MLRYLAATAAALALAGCTDSAPHIATLYRNSSVDNTMRIHFATFDADESSAAFNINNCQMAARLLNANVRALGSTNSLIEDPAAAEDAVQVVGFWCEPGPFVEHGLAPMRFDSEFPTDSQ